MINSTVDGSDRRRAGRRDLHARGRRHDRRLDSERQPRRRPGRGHRRRGRRHGDRLDDRPQRRRSRTSAAGSGPAATSFVTNSTISHNYAEGEGGGLLAAGSPGPGRLDRGRQRRPGGGSIGGGQDRLRPSARSSGRRTRRPSAARCSRSKTNCRMSSTLVVVRLQLRQRRLLRPRSAERRDGCLDPMLAVHLGDNGGIGETRMPEPGSPVLDSSSTSSCVHFRPVWLFARGRAASRSIWNRSACADNSRPARHLPSAGRRLRRRFRRTWRGERSSAGPDGEALRTEGRRRAGLPCTLIERPPAPWRAWVPAVRVSRRAADLKASSHRSLGR